MKNTANTKATQLTALVRSAKDHQITDRQGSPNLYVSATDTARLIRFDLKQFVGVKFSVKTDQYAGGSSIHVSWVDGPSEAEVNSVIGHYVGSTFDGMTDSTTYHDTLHLVDGVAWSIHYSPNFLFTRRNVSDEFVATFENDEQIGVLSGSSGPCHSCCGFTQPDTDGWRVDGIGPVFDSKLCAQKALALKTSQPTTEANK